MSCNYADGLSPYEHKGKLGIPEVFDDDETVEQKVTKLADWMATAKHIVVHTGAGISTAAGIPDFRGPNGVWTLEEKGQKPNINISFDNAQPTYTHMGLSALVSSGHIKYVISQNIDGMHLRSGLKRSNLSELHGNMFIGQCTFCEREFIQPKSVPTVGQKEFGEKCPYVKLGGRTCRGKLHDNILDWEHNLPDRDLDMAIMHSTLADLSICLGTTLQIIPAGNLPLRAKKNGGKVVIVNLQPTKHHKKADLTIHTHVDKVIRKVAEILGVSIPQYTEDMDPTHILRRDLNSGKVISRDWTIPSSTISKFRKEIASLNDQKKKKPNKSVRKRKKQEDSSSEEEYHNITKTKSRGSPQLRDQLKNETEDQKKILKCENLHVSQNVGTVETIEVATPPKLEAKLEEFSNSDSDLQQSSNCTDVNDV